LSQVVLAEDQAGRKTAGKPLLIDPLGLNETLVEVEGEPRVFLVDVTTDDVGMVRWIEPVGLKKADRFLARVRKNRFHLGPGRRRRAYRAGAVDHVPGFS